jgi:hypothetical protein
VRAAATAVALAVLAAGCGRSEGEAFRADRLKPAEKRLEASQARVVATLRAVRPRRAAEAAALRRDVARLERETERVARLRPPAGARAVFERYVRARRRVTEQLRAFEAALRRGDAGELSALTQSFASAVGSAQREHETLERVLLSK